MTKLSHLPWYWQAEWGLNACTCGLLALVWKPVLWGKKIWYFIIQIWFLFHVNSCHDIHFCESFLSGVKRAHMYLWYGFIFKLSQDKERWITSIQMCCLYMCLLHSKWEERENQPKQTENIQSMTICNIYAKSFIQQRHIPGQLAASIIQIRNI